MNFNSLPNETLQRIVDLCHEADENYRKRKENNDTKPGETRVLAKKEKATGVAEILNYDEWWGRSCSAMSMVNKNLRSMAIKHLFTASPSNPFFSSFLGLTALCPQTLRLSKDQDDVFQYSILGSSTSHCITEVIFDSIPRSDQTCLFAFVCHTLPCLPSLRTVSGFNLRFSRQLSLNSIPAPAAKLLKSRCARNSLAQIATQIKTWKVMLNSTVVELLVPQNYSGIESLSLQSPVDDGFPILESDESNFPTLLAPCSNLRELVIEHTHDCDETNVEPVADFVLSTTFSFANTLRSLSLDLERFGGRTTANEFRFAALFPSLEVLKITFRSSNLDEIDSKPFLLPKLASLEVVNCPFLHMHILIRSLTLPSISSIDLAQRGFRLYQPTSEEEILEIGRLVAELGAYSSTLQTFQFTFSGISQSAVEEFRGLQDDVTIEVNSELVVFSSETADTSNRPKVQPSDPEDANDSSSGDESDSETSDPAQRRVGGIDQDVKLTEELLGWAHERVKDCQDVDDAGVEEMMRVFEPVKELRDWLQD